MAVIAAGIGAVAVVGGLLGSLSLDTPSGPSIVVVAFALFLLSLLRLPTRMEARGAETTESDDPCNPTDPEHSGRQHSGRRQLHGL